MDECIHVWKKVKSTLESKGNVVELYRCKKCRKESISRHKIGERDCKESK
jgi:tRNA(Ile2) C34 agmatinyltransferase TiaS